MGYTHYWYRRDREIPRNIFNAILSDFIKLVPALEDFGILLADGHGKGVPTLDSDLISFNGKRRCGHPASYELGIAWPTTNAGGIANPWREDVRSKPWFGGLTIEKRICAGDCSHETCYFPRAYQDDEASFDSHPGKREGTGWQFECCKTAYKPYDLAVTAFLVIAKHHLKESIHVVSDGVTQHWADARIICTQHLSYGIDFELDR
ncbi:MAG: hypothetical protein COV74_00170 [Candidatus Omnitrophica bacterium CG11_big_fil_rev_8_21_14_0_20_45_26]|uniref:Uncharacterized protein n=1 Tax=Candidatus Abzuiibacterium crystallinum TaxID=1974748 RepID=A0A2H0LT36_9BACT|nr:MAG: hypothetical protein COV74_00170 [Candidatus Omnitrophica bacterium CG11_big_fil_rev_8_21_14_0_20_45_26]PIW64792.1 MAG: hypothetical protein COW12_04635 [Candidatus Omnitrophica bacterium CG12_big_fil_rev_8_21_14_0_65_45_16]